ncbi:alginate lyase family protein [Porifericola rhodea]|uniref:alginate lyase family protein n=1 Tax=Porifericola rhodea TaxID=930972 RepID=UPI0026656F0C|nr:alginate lyase family protein [Porifericola rhodea]WKN30496.1 alginate lyase family protein [Porifericola rhodea]
MSLSWYYYRLRTMSVPEIGFRVQQYLQKKREKRKLDQLVPQHVALQEPPPSLLSIGDFDFKLENQSIEIFGQQFNYNQTIDWHLDISSGKRFPMDFAKDINIRTEEFGSAKHVWEVNRMQFLTLIALQYRQTKDEHYLNQFQEVLSSWLKANPYLRGVNWYSNIEVNIRLIVWFFSWEILNVNELRSSHPEFSKFVDQHWLPSIYLHMRYSYENPSKYSSANNHLISEHAGLFIASCFWKFEESEHWLAHAQEGLEQEIALQHSTEGVNKEEAAEYIQFITDFFLIPYIVGQKASHSFSPAYSSMLEKICEYIYQMMDLRGNIVYYGDEDDGKVLILDPEHHFDNFKSILTSGAILFNNSQWKQLDNGFDIKNAVLFGAEGKKRYEALSTSTEDNTSKFYLEEGHFILRKQERKKNREVFVHFDAAPLGFLSIAAHGHSDALSFVLHVDGYPIITDSGTYTYHTEREWRQYFLSALAHNTITIDGQNQAMVAGPTMWLKHYKTQVVAQDTNAEEDMIHATHDGYSKLGIEHHRRLRFVKTKDELSISDQLLFKKTGEHQIEMPLHLHPAVKIQQKSEREYLLKHPKARAVLITLPTNVVSEVMRGNTNPILGWYSASFQVKEPTSVIYSKCHLNKTSELNTQIKILEE